MTTVSMVAPYWRTGGGRDEGLFFYCDGGGCEGLDEISVGSEGRWKEGWREGKRGLVNREEGGWERGRK